MELIKGISLQGEKYKILDKISQGNFGITYLAEQTNLDRKVCIKEFFFKGYCERSQNGYVTVTTSGREISDSFRRKFIREAKRLSQFDHPNIVKVIDVFEENGTAYMVMDYIEGESLQQLIDREGKIPEQEVLAIIVQVCDALEVVHNKGLLHLDIKPSNILLKKRSIIPVLIDFGISKFTEASGEDHATTTPVALTKGYAPLEQYGQDISELSVATDIYSVGATIYKLITGVTPIEPSLIVRKGLISPLDYNPSINKNLCAILLKCMSIQINDRPISVHQLKVDLLSLSKIDSRENTIVIESNHPSSNFDNNELVRTKKEGKSTSLKFPMPITILVIIIICAFSFAVFKQIDLSNIGISFQPNKGVSSNQNSRDNEISTSLKNLEAEQKQNKLIIAAQQEFINNLNAKNTETKAPQVQYDQVYAISNGLARVVRNGKYGFIDQKGNEIIPPQFDIADDFKYDYTVVGKGGRYFYINKRGEWLRDY